MPRPPNARSSAAPSFALFFALCLRFPSSKAPIEAELSRLRKQVVGMALPTPSPAPPASPQLIGNAFIQQYYHILHQQPEFVHKFYQDSSILSRPNSDGLMTSVTTMQAINDIILSLDFNNCFTEIETVDSQISYKDGVLIIVTGSFTGRDNVRRKFTESFFLAPQENGGYFVLNDVFRFLNETQPRELHHVLVNGTTEDGPKASLIPDPEPVTQEHVVEETTLSDADVENNKEVNEDPSENISSGAEEEVVVDPQIRTDENNVQPVSEVATSVIASVAQDDAPKKSYASIVKVMKNGPSTTAVYVPTTKAKTVAPVKAEKPIAEPPKEVPAVETTSPANDNATENNSPEEEGHSIYIKNLPLNATAEQVEEEFKRFGSIKPGGVQVRSHKVEPFCFGFVEFVSLQSMQAAIEASPLSLGGRQAFVEEKRTTTRVVNGVVTTSGNGPRGRFQPGRGGFRNDNFRGRGNFGANMGFRRNEFRNRVDYSGRGRRPTSRGGGGSSDGYQRVYQNGNDKVWAP